MYDPNKVHLPTVALKAFSLGITLTISLFAIFTMPQISSRVPVYILSISIFHLSEFFCTSIYNTSEVDDDSFILNDTELLAVYAASIVEYAVRTYFLPSHHPWVVSTVAGLALISLGQTFRSLAMATAKESFNHYIQREHKSKHKLVTHGIYGVSRHPSYFGFYWLIVGHQIWLGNWLMWAVSSYKLWKFFKNRIKFEEEYLVSFFGEEYLNYRKSTRVLIPFIA